jgi:hypothetical protein
MAALLPHHKHQLLSVHLHGSCCKIATSKQGWSSLRSYLTQREERCQTVRARRRPQRSLIYANDVDASSAARNISNDTFALVSIHFVRVFPSSIHYWCKTIVDTNERPFTCACGSSFTRRDLLRRHERINHAGDVPTKQGNSDALKPAAVHDSDRQSLHQGQLLEHASPNAVDGADCLQQFSFASMQVERAGFTSGWILISRLRDCQHTDQAFRSIQATETSQ